MLRRGLYARTSGRHDTHAVPSGRVVAPLTLQRWHQDRGGGGVSRDNRPDRSSRRPSPFSLLNGLAVFSGPLLLDTRTLESTKKSGV